VNAQGLTPCVDRLSTPLSTDPVHKSVRAQSAIANFSRSWFANHRGARPRPLPEHPSLVSKAQAAHPDKSIKSVDRASPFIRAAYGQALAPGAVDLQTPESTRGQQFEIDLARALTPHNFSRNIRDSGAKRTVQYNLIVILRFRFAGRSIDCVARTNHGSRKRTDAAFSGLASHPALLAITTSARFAP
jgi:hypothetical protein